MARFSAATTVGRVHGIELEQDPHVYARRWWILGVLVLSLVMIMTANTSLNITLPRLQGDTAASSTELQWIVDIYALVFGGLVLTAGALGDRFGRKGALLWGLALFGTMSLFATFASQPSQLIATRAVQGLGAALIMPGTLSIIAAVFPPRERQHAIAIWAGFAGSGAAIGIVLSGWLLEHFWWGSVFFVNVPLAMVSITLVGLLVPRSRDPRGLPLDVPGAILSVLALGGLLFGIIEGPERGWTDPLTVAGFAIALVASISFLTRERRTAYPMLDLAFFSHRGFSVGVSTIALTFFAMFGLMFVLTIYLQVVKGYGPLAAGIRIIPLSIAMVISATASSRLALRLGNRTIISAGLLLIAAGLLVVTTLDPSTPYLQLAFGLVLVGVGMGNVAAPATGEVMASLPVAKAGVGSAVNDAAREVGGALGIAVIGSIVASLYRSNLGALGGLSGDAHTRATRSVTEAVAVAQEVGGDLGGSLADAARAAYADAMGTALLVAAAVVVGAAVMVWRTLPRSAELPAERAPATEQARESFP